MMAMRILITGKNSYIGNSIQNWLLAKPHSEFYVEQLDVQTENWKTFDYSSYDTIIHVAGIVHRKDISDYEIYKKVNTELPFEIAKVAKSQGVRQFIFLSTMAVYGIGKKLRENIVEENTPLNPRGMYATSKYDAEQLLNTLNDIHFKIVIVRPPNVYGKGCKGGYISGFTKIVRMLPVIPEAYKNVRQSMIYIDNLCEFICLVIQHNKSGVYTPQDGTIPSATELMVEISKAIGKKGIKSRALGGFAYLLAFTPIVKKAFGGIAYSEQMTSYFGSKYQVFEFKEAIRRTVGNE